MTGSRKCYILKPSHPGPNRDSNSPCRGVDSPVAEKWDALTAAPPVTLAPQLYCPCRCCCCCCCSSSSSSSSCFQVESNQRFKLILLCLPMPGAWRHTVSAGTGWPGVSTPCLGDIASWICNFDPSVASRGSV